MKQRSESVPVAMRPVYQETIALTNSFCEQRLNEEWAQLCRELAAALARKRPSPLVRNKPANSACGIVHALGTVNLLFDKSYEYYIAAGDLAAAFGVSRGTCSNYAAKIRELFRMYQFDPDWCLPSLLDRNPMAWMVEFGGLVVDARDMPRAFQELAYAKGLIPYIPADRAKQGDVAGDAASTTRASRLVTFLGIFGKDEEDKPDS